MTAGEQRAAEIAVRDELAEEYEIARRAISDPGTVTPRTCFRRGEYEVVPDWQTRAVLDALAPVVDRIARARAAEELRQEARAAHCRADYHRLLDRANALDPT